jgi:hypothetical protein
MNHIALKARRGVFIAMSSRGLAFRKTKDKRYIVQKQRARNEELEKKGYCLWPRVARCILLVYDFIVIEDELKPRLIHNSR